MKYVLIYSIIYIFNIVLYGSPFNLIITIPSILYVLFLIFKGDLSRALFFHLIFIVTSVSHVAIGDFDGAITPYGYFSLKLYGPLTISYLINILLFIQYLTKKKLRIDKTNHLHKLFLVFVYFAASGCGLGLIGMLFAGYSVNYFITYNVYIMNLIMLMTCMLCERTSYLQIKGKLHLYYILKAGILSSFILFLLGSTMEYGGVNVVTRPDISSLSFLIIASLAPNSKQKTNVIYILLYLFILMLGGASGKDFIFIAISLLYVLYFYFRTNPVKAIVVATLCTAPILIILNTGIEFNQLFNDKFSQFSSLLNIFNGHLDEVARSPYIRIASMINIYSENLTNPIYFLLGRGYGGYFTDSLGLFSGIDLYLGAFSPEQINSGHFYSAHSSLAVIPLLHGFGGIAIIGIMIWRFVRLSKYDHCFLVVIPWILLMFYYNLLLAIICLFFIYSSYDNSNTLSQK